MYVLACLRGDSPSAASARNSSARFASASAPPSSYSSTVGTVKKANVSPESDETAYDSSSTAAKNGDCGGFAGIHPLCLYGMPQASSASVALLIPSLSP